MDEWVWGRPCKASDLPCSAGVVRSYWSPWEGLLVSHRAFHKGHQPSANFRKGETNLVGPSSVNFSAKMYYLPKKENSLGRVNTLTSAWDMISGIHFLLLSQNYNFFVGKGIIYSIHQCPIPQTRPSWEHWVLLNKGCSPKFNITSILSKA